MEARQVFLPEGVAEFEGDREQVAAATWFAYDAVSEEVGLGSVRPDIIISRAGRELLVEAAVTHFCDAEKVTKLRDRNLPAIEIDLSAVPRLASRNEHARLILHEAPRTWLHNAKIHAAEGRLKQAAELRRAERLRHQKVAWTAEADKLAAATREPLESIGGRWAVDAREAGLGGLLGHDVEGDFCFSVTRETWQAFTITFAWQDQRGEPFHINDVLSRILSRGYLRHGFDQITWPPDKAKFIGERLPGCKPPPKVLAEYAAQLAKIGFLGSLGGGHFYVAPGPLQKANETARRAEKSRKRGEELDRLLKPLRGALGSNAEGIIERWTETPLRGAPDTPKDLVEKGGGAWQDLTRALQDLSIMVNPGGSPLPQHRLLALPLDEVRRKRIAETEAREAVHAERRRRTATTFLAEITSQAETELGVEPGRAWLAARLGDVTAKPGMDESLETNSPFRRELEAAFQTEVYRVKAEASAQAVRMLTRADAELRQEALRRKLRAVALAALKNAYKVEVWMQSCHPALGGSPLNVCVDEMSLDRCSRLLKTTHRK